MHGELQGGVLQCLPWQCLRIPSHRPMSMHMKKNPNLHRSALHTHAICCLHAYLRPLRGYVCSPRTRASAHGNVTKIVLPSR